ncbi:PstS family phosphate ABC transporter substrate-binding protein [Haloarchaeobius sp. DFWS5]|uniref:PstS family phosphate ABC transporter substrate-binding protein n=1 Tax=Haloarchaeobius sp. DFWS5 TaxID=3446114 RepID=UPI003EBD35A6
MTSEKTRLVDGVSRRKLIATTGAAGVAALAGCTESSDGEDTDAPTDSGNGNEGGNSDSDTEETESGDNSGGMDTQPLTADGSSTVFPITNTGASYWNSNPEKGDGDYWPTEAAEKVGTDKRLADYWAGLYGYEATGNRSQPPFLTNVALSHSGTGVEGVSQGRVDIGDSSAPVADELPDASDEKLNKFIDHVVGVDGQPIVVSKAIYDAGVEQIDIEELKGIYKGDINNWSEVGGPDKEIVALGRATGSGTATAFRANVFGDPEAQTNPDRRFGQNQQLKQAIAGSDAAIAYIALAFVDVDAGVQPISLKVEGTTYTYGENLGAKDYPLSRDLHCYTWEDTSRKEAAFLNFLLSDFGQERFVAPNNYFKLPQERLKEERGKVAASKYE